MKKLVLFIAVLLSLAYALSCTKIGETRFYGIDSDQYRLTGFNYVIYSTIDQDSRAILNLVIHTPDRKVYELRNINLMR